jgi:hypothetical protein
MSLLVPPGPAGPAGPAALPEGVPSEVAVVAEYFGGDTARASAVVASEAWRYFLALALFRAASIASGVYARAVQGNASQSRQAGAFRDVIPVLARTAWTILQPRGTAATAALTPASAPAPSTATGLEPSPRCRELLRALRAFNDEVAIPAERTLIEHYQQAQGRWPERGDRWQVHPTMHALATEARARGLWNLWLPEHTAQALRAAHPSWPWPSLLPHGVGLSHTDYAFLAVESGRCLFTPDAINCSAPDTGNMEIIAKFGTSAQRDRWLLPLMTGEIRSCFGMTEPAVASSDPTQLRATATKVASGERAGGEVWEVRGEKWWTTGATDPRCQVCIFVALTDNDRGDGTGRGAPSAASASYRRHTLFLLPMDDPAVTVVRPLTVLGYDDAPKVL